jgi:hypothetical protein
MSEEPDANRMAHELLAWANVRWPGISNTQVADALEGVMLQLGQTKHDVPLSPEESLSWAKNLLRQVLTKKFKPPRHN